jgi:pilus assembly protein CpaB
MASRNTGGRARAAVFLLISAVAAIVAVGVVYTMIQSYQKQLDIVSRPPETIEVVVAKVTLFQGQTLAETDVELKKVAPEYVPETVFHTIEEVVGRVPAERIIQGEYVRRERLADPEAGVGLNAIIPRGQRAVSINITNASAVSGFLNPGNYVDVLATVKTKGEGQKTVTMLQAKRLLAVNNRLGGDGGEGGVVGTDARVKPSVTLALTPEEAELMVHAFEEGVVTLTLRNDIDVINVDTEGTRAANLLGDDTKVIKYTNVKAKRTEKAPCKVSVIKGRKEAVYKCN